MNISIIKALDSLESLPFDWMYRVNGTAIHIDYPYQGDHFDLASFFNSSMRMISAVSIDIINSREYATIIIS